MLKDDVNFFESDGYTLAYRDKGNGQPILLIHGFASSSWVNWVAPGWFRTLNDAGYRVIAIDNRGHGFSQKIHDEKAYTPEAMADDAVRLLDHLGIENAHIMGYSMGARITAFACLRHAARVQSAIFGGLGIGMVTGAGRWEPVAEALLADDIASISSERGLMFRKFADQTQSDRLALAACVITSKKELTAAEVFQIKQPVLVAVGSTDEIGGDPVALAALLPNGEPLVIEGRDHMLAVGDKIYKKGVLEFLARHPIGRR
ncbi:MULTISPECIES: alpha/beta fold hydrolase [unclassified Bartonella]|uniref:alpha/beta fold hydrolase n=1 Tax=unclassified Bartonella TaxID=2645622 RepID=UPI0015FA7281|nr:MULTISPECIES: alpha/beta hydrolase [unclassified Bartonella]UXN07473.1 alpha/beta hydrolase [Bartonella sp. HY761]